MTARLAVDRGEWITRARERVGWRMTDLALAMRATGARIRDWETHGCHQRLHLGRLYTTLGVPETLRVSSTLPMRMRWVRQHSGLARNTFADRIGVLNFEAGRYERGYAPVPPEIVAKVARVFGVDLAWLTSGDAKGEPSEFRAWLGPEEQGWTPNLEAVEERMSREAAGATLRGPPEHPKGALQPRTEDSEDPPIVEWCRALLYAQGLGDEYAVTRVDAEEPIRYEEAEVSTLLLQRARRLRRQAAGLERAARGRRRREKSDEQPGQDGSEGVGRM